MEDRDEENTPYACIHIPAFIYTRLNRCSSTKKGSAAYMAVGKIRLPIQLLPLRPRSWTDGSLNLLQSSEVQTGVYNPHREIEASNSTRRN